MRILKYISAMAVVALFAACDNIPEDERYIAMDPGGDDPEEETVVRNVFMEEFTGQLCINCPKGHETIESLEAQYGDRFICVSIHAGGNAFSIGEGQIPGYVGLRVDEGEQYASEAGTSSYPCAMIDGIGGLVNYDKWAKNVYDQMQTAPGVDIAMKARYDAATSMIVVDASVKELEVVNSPRIYLWVVENDIVAYQIGPNNTEFPTYVHNNVFRSSIGGHNGIALNFDTPDNAPATVSASIAKKDNWVVENLEIVGFVTDGKGAVANAQRVAVGVE